MKLNKILVAGLGVLMLTACVKADEVVVDPNAEYDATISLNVTTSQNLGTKTSTDGGTENGTTVENAINKLTAVVFKGDARYTYRDVTPSGTNTVLTAEEMKVEGISVKAKEGGTDYSIVILANYDDATLPSSLTMLKKGATSPLTSTLDKENDGFMTMTSAIIPVKIIGRSNSVDAPTQNYVVNGTSGTVMVEGDEGVSDAYNSAAAKIGLTRLAARIQLQSIKINTEKVTSFVLTNAYIINAKSTSNIFATTANQDCVITGESNFINGIGRTTDYTGQNIITNIAANTGYARAFDPTITINSSSTVNFFGEGYTPFIKYVYENDAKDLSWTDGAAENPKTIQAYTRLILKGDVTPVNGPTETGKYYNVIIRKTDAPATYIFRNTLYKINVTITGRGSDIPDDPDLNASINAQIEVLPWNVINQTEDDTN